MGSYILYEENIQKMMAGSGVVMKALENPCKISLGGSLRGTGARSAEKSTFTNKKDTPQSEPWQVKWHCRKNRLGEVDSVVSAKPSDVTAA